MSYIFPTFVLAETSDAFMVNSWIQDELLSTIYYTPAELFEESDRMKAAIRYHPASTNRRCRFLHIIYTILRSIGYNVPVIILRLNCN